jgi:glycosyltransferase involved in cell wall biosynthesis
MAAGLANVAFHGRVGYERALAMMYRADTLIATYDPSIPNHRYASPNKLFEAMMLAKPIVVARGTNMDRIVERHGCGLVVEYGNLRDLAAAMGRLAHDLGLRHRLGAAGRKAYEQEYNWDIMRERLVHLYQAL